MLNSYRISEIREDFI